MVGEIVRGTGNVEYAIFNVAPDVNSDLYVMVSVAQRNHIGILVDIVFECLGIPGVTSKPETAVVEANLGYAGMDGAGGCVVQRVAGAKLVQHRWTEGMHPAHLPAGKQVP